MADFYAFPSTFVASSKSAGVGNMFRLFHGSFAWRLFSGSYIVKPKCPVGDL